MFYVYLMSPSLYLSCSSNVVSVHRSRISTSRCLWQRVARCATDCTSNIQVSSGESDANRTRQRIRRLLTGRWRVTDGLVSLEHVENVDSPADFLTRWLPAKRCETSLLYATNASVAIKLPRGV